MKKLIATVAALTALSPLAANAEMVNDIRCTLNKGYTIPKLYAFQQSWMAAAKKQGYDEAAYKTQIFFPVYTEDTRTEPMVFLWRGTFASGEVWGKLGVWFPASGWAEKFTKVMNCSKAALFIAPQ